MEVGMIGCGRMAAAIASNLLAAGHQLTVFSPPSEKGRDLTAIGATIAERVGDACNADAVITVLRSDQRVEEVVLGPGGVAAAMPAAAVHICMSTIDIELSRRLSAAHAQRVQRYLAAPVFGDADAAAKGELCIFVAGRPGTISRCQPLFDVLGRSTVEAGRHPEDANLLQLCAIGLVGSLVESLGESIALADKGGIAPERFLKLMSQSLFAGGLHAGYGALAAVRGESSIITVNQGRRYAALLLDSANALNARLPLISVLSDRLDSLMNRGLGALDWLTIATSRNSDGSAGDSDKGGEQAEGSP